MVSLQELYAAIKDDLTDAPVYKGDLTDWWADGVGSTPYAVKHLKKHSTNTTCVSVLTKKPAKSIRNSGGRRRII